MVKTAAQNEDARASRLELQNTKTIFSGEYLDEITSEMVEDFKSARKHEVRRKAKDSRLVTGTTVNRALETHYNRSSELMRIIRKLLKRVVRPERFELPTLWFEDKSATSRKALQFSSHLENTPLNSQSRMYADVSG